MVGRSVSRRSRWSAGLGPALRFVVALIALVAIGAPAVLLTGSASAQDTPAADATTTPAPAPADPPPTTTTEDPPPADGQSPQWAPTATYEAPAPAQSAPEADTPDAADPADPTGDDESQPADGVVAHNQSTVVQAIVQVQVGCRSYCHGTSQNQSASQGSSTNQNATAVAPEGSSSTATAVNESSTIQFVWQTQLGCVIFCWDTTMDQSASQEAETTQTATAVSDTAAQASNVGDTIQHVYQRQEGCRSECYGVSESQSLVQRQTTNQSASASRGDAADDWPSAGLGGLPDWLIAYAESIGATIQTIYQYQEAGCLDHCGEEALDQTATQLAATDQTSEAGDVREPVSGPLWGGPDQPAAAGPALEQPAAQSG